MTDTKERFEERAAILEYCANYSREEAERAAMTEVRRRVDMDKRGMK